MFILKTKNKNLEISYNTEATIIKNMKEEECPHA